MRNWKKGKSRKKDNRCQIEKGRKREEKEVKDNECQVGKGGTLYSEKEKKKIELKEKEKKQTDDAKPENARTGTLSGRFCVQRH